MFLDTIFVASGKRHITPKNLSQKHYIDNIRAHDLTFGIGPAGTGKTYLAMALAVAALVGREVKRIILTRPAVEAGERLGFLPGDLVDKVNPYLRPLYDALYDMLDFARVQRLMSENAIEVAPLAFMRGRTLNDAFVVLDEAQNTTREQMKMFLTRLGFRSKAVVTGDMTQTDLEDKSRSGLAHARRILDDVPGDRHVLVHGRGTWSATRSSHASSRPTSAMGAEVLWQHPGPEDAGLVQELARPADAALDAGGVVEREMALVLTGDEAIAALNAQWRGKDGPTDVLSFPQDEGEAMPLGDEPAPLGDVVISLDTAAAQATARGAELLTEVTFLMVHGVCHLLGHDHAEPEEAARMRAFEDRLLAAAAPGEARPADPVLTMNADLNRALDHAPAIAVIDAPRPDWALHAASALHRR